MALPHWLHQLETCPSTNRWAMEHLHFLNHGDAAFTRRQTEGRGQYGRSWQSPPGVITATFVLHHFPLSRIHLVSLIAGLAVIETLETLMPELQGLAQLKWTNDILIRGRKVSGILCETRSMNSECSKETLTTAIVGIGLNRVVDFASSGIDPAQIGNPISLHQVSKNIPSEFQLLSVLRDRLMQSATMKAIMQLDPDLNTVNWVDQVRSRDALLGKQIKFETATEIIEGLSKGINDRGELLIQDQDGMLRAFHSGRILHY